MPQSPTDHLTDAELTAFLDAMFPHGVAGPDVMAEIVPEGWERSPLLACIQPSVGRGLEAQPGKPYEELAELVGMCLWDVFSDNHEVLDADGRSVDLGSFRGASAFLDDYISGRRGEWLRDDYLRFYMGTFAIAGRADLTPVYVSTFRRLQAAGGNWIYDEGAAARLRTEVAEANQHGREEAMDGPPPATVRAYRQVYGRAPRGWPPA